MSFLSMIEPGERVAHVETLAALATALGLSLSELLAIPLDGSQAGDNVVQPLADFARSRGLTAQDIDKLLGVARAMFTGSNSDRRSHS